MTSALNTYIWSATADSRNMDNIQIVQVAFSLEEAQANAHAFFGNLDSLRPAYKEIICRSQKIESDIRNLRNAICLAKEAKKKARREVFNRQIIELMERVEEEEAIPVPEEIRISKLESQRVLIYGEIKKLEEQMERVEEETEPIPEEIRISKHDFERFLIYEEIKKLEEQIEGQHFFGIRTQCVFEYSLDSRIYSTDEDVKTIGELLAKPPVVKKFRPAFMVGTYTG